jgi:hypothetical protein
MPGEAFKPAIRAALRMHEIGVQTPYKLYFAGKGKSGASFGFMQGDLAAGQPVVTSTFQSVMHGAGVASTRIATLIQALSVHLLVNPLSAADTKLVNDALVAGRTLVDQMDEQILADIYHDLDRCIAAATQNGRTLTGRGMLYAAMWINMSGHPTKLLAWLGGGDPHLSHSIPQAPATIEGKDVRTYLMATDYYITNPGNAPHLDESVQAGAVLLP